MRRLAFLYFDFLLPYFLPLSCCRFSNFADSFLLSLSRLGPCDENLTWASLSFLRGLVCENFCCNLQICSLPLSPADNFLFPLPLTLSLPPICFFANSADFFLMTLSRLGPCDENLAWVSLSLLRGLVRENYYCNLQTCSLPYLSCRQSYLLPSSPLPIFFLPILPISFCCLYPGLGPALIT